MSNVERQRFELLDQIAINARVLAQAREIFEGLQARRNVLLAELAELEQRCAA
jgi:hypothetical protein